jgi:hypothetical protein
VIGASEIREAVRALHADPRPAEATFASLGMDDDEVALVLGPMVGTVVDGMEREHDVSLGDEIRIDCLRLALTTFLIGVSVGRVAAHDEVVL